MNPSEFEIRLFSEAIFSAIYNGSWQLTTDSLHNILNLTGPDF